MQSNYSIIRLTLNAEFNTLWFSGVFANTVALIPTLYILVETSCLGECCYVPSESIFWCFRAQRV